MVEIMMVAGMLLFTALSLLLTGAPTIQHQLKPGVVYTMVHNPLTHTSRVTDTDKNMVAMVATHASIIHPLYKAGNQRETWNSLAGTMLNNGTKNVFKRQLQLHPNVAAFEVKSDDGGTRRQQTMLYTGMTVESTGAGPCNVSCTLIIKKSCTVQAQDTEEEVSQCIVFAHWLVARLYA